MNVLWSNKQMKVFTQTFYDNSHGDSNLVKIDSIKDLVGHVLTISKKEIDNSNNNDAEQDDVHHEATNIFSWLFC